jgi:hypothetical protein
MGETMNDDFLTRFQKSPRPEFESALHKRINKPMGTENHSIRHLGTAVAAAALFLVLLFAFSPTVRVFAQQGVIQLGRLLISHDPTYAEQFETRINSGTPTATTEPDPVPVEWQAPPLLTVDEASTQAGFPTRQIGSLPENMNIVARFITQPDSVNFSTQITTTYQSGGLVLVFGQRLYEPDSTQQVMPVGDATVTGTTVQGVDGTWIEGLRLSTYVDDQNKVALQFANVLIWEKDGFEFWLQSTPGLSLEDMLKIAESIF